jgi:hypothetical protein
MRKTPCNQDTKARRRREATALADIRGPQPQKEIRKKNADPKVGVS